MALGLTHLAVVVLAMLGLNKLMDVDVSKEKKLNRMVTNLSLLMIFNLSLVFFTSFNLIMIAKGPEHEFFQGNYLRIFFEVMLLDFLIQDI